MKLRDEKGLAEMIVIGILAVLVIGGSLYFYFSRQQNTAKDGASVVSQLTGGAVACDYDDKDICKFLNKFEAQNYYTVTSSSGSGAEATEMTVKISGEDKSQVIMTTGGKESMNSITLGKDSYTKDVTDGKWWKSTAGDDKPTTDLKDELTFKTDDETKTEGKEPEKSEYKKIGQEACGSLTCYKYEVIDKSSAEPLKSYIWFDNKDYLLRKTESETEGSVAVVNYTYEKFELAAPSPVKEGAPYSTQ